MTRHAAAFTMVLVIALGGLAAALPVGAAPPASRDCDAAFPADQYNDRLDCKTENANVALFDYVDSVIELDRVGRSFGRDPIFTDTQMDHLLAGRDRAQSAKDRTHGAEGFRGVVKKQKPDDEDCYVQEVLGDMGGPHGGDDDGVCTAGEDCEELLDDGIGDDDGVCKLKGNNREVCVQVCQQPLAGDEENYDPNVALETEQGLDEVEVAIVDATNEVKKATQRMREFYATRPADRALTDCEMYEFDLFPGPLALQLAQGAKNVTSAAFNGCSVVCSQDAFGWNCSAVCLAFAILDGIAQTVNDAFQIIDGNNGSAQLDRVARCTTQLGEEVESISASVDGTQETLDEVNVKLDLLEAKIDALAEMIDARFNGVDAQLCTPQGQRECFPIGHGGSETSAPPAPAPATSESQVRKPRAPARR